MSPTRMLAAAAAVALVSFAGPALAAGSSSNDNVSTQNAAFAAGQRAVENENWPEAIDKFAAATMETPDDADAWNMLAYSQRMSGDLESAFANYQKALAIDPDHKDAHEYIGEAYLQIGDLAGAEKHLAALDDICWLGCDQEDELAAAIEAWKAEHGS